MMEQALIHQNEWDAIPARERFELLATIEEMRDWRYDGIEPMGLKPIRQSALELYKWLNRRPL